MNMIVSSIRTIFSFSHLISFLLPPPLTINSLPPSLSLTSVTHILFFPSLLCLKHSNELMCPGFQDVMSFKLFVVKEVQQERSNLKQLKALS